MHACFPTNPFCAPWENCRYLHCAGSRGPIKPVVQVAHPPQLNSCMREWMKESAPSFECSLAVCITILNLLPLMFPRKTILNLFQIKFKHLHSQTNNGPVCFSLWPILKTWFWKIQVRWLPKLEIENPARYRLSILDFRNHLTFGFLKIKPLKLAMSWNK